MKTEPPVSTRQKRRISTATKVIGTTLLLGVGALALLTARGGP